MKHAYLLLIHNNFDQVAILLSLIDDVRNDIYNVVLQNVDNREVIEGYSGAGLLSAIIAKKAKKVFAVEINKNATKDADYLKKINNLTNLQNINGDCSKVLPELAKQNPNAIFLIDPPRSGCDQNTLKAIKENNTSKVIYISCNPYTLKQNLKFLSDIYNIDSIQIFDMFPNTSNIESLAFLSKK
jgi:23S rRNA (uracil1939-C5)-methyltransferase